MIPAIVLAASVAEGVIVPIIVAGFSAGALVMVAMVNRAGRNTTDVGTRAADAAEAAWEHMVGDLQRQVKGCHRRERRHLTALEWAYGRIGELERHVGLPPGQPPPLADEEDEE